MTGRTGSRADCRSLRLLAVSDDVDYGFWSGTSDVPPADLIVACGDLPADYLARLMNALDVPLVFVPGNHDADMSGYRQARNGLLLRAGLPAGCPWPDGAINADGRVVDAAGLRLAGLGGCVRYGRGPNQYTERQQARRALALRCRAAASRMTGSGPVDVLLTHAPPRGAGDGDDPAHLGFACYRPLVAALAPAALLHGHVQPPAAAGQVRIGRTVIRNVTGWQLLEIEPGGLLTEPTQRGRHAR
jgi:hypothetical protein